MFVSLSSPLLFIVLTLAVLGTAGLGILAGARLRGRSEAGHNSVGVVQGTLLGLVGLLLAFGLTMSVGRYEMRRQLVVKEANAIGTTYLRAQMLSEPARSTSLDLLKEYTDRAIDLADQVPNNADFRADRSRLGELQRELWAAAGVALAADPAGTAPRLYIETLNDTIDANGERVASLFDRVPSTVLLLQVIGGAVAIGVLALYLSLLGRGATTSLVASIVVIMILFVSFDLDRPQRGFITVPFASLTDARAQMDEPPAVTVAP